MKWADGHWVKRVRDGRFAFALRQYWYIEPPGTTAESQSQYWHVEVQFTVGGIDFTQHWRLRDVELASDLEVLAAEVVS